MARKGTKQVRYYDSDGQVHWASGKTSSQAAKNAANKQRDIHEGKVALNGKMTVRAWSEEFFKTYKGGLEPSTKRGYQNKIDHWILSSIGDERLEDVKPIECQAILNGMAGMATDTIRKVKQLMTLMFTTAVDNELIYKNPATRLTMPKGTVSTNRTVTDAERRLIIDIASQDPRYIYFLVILYCGCRPKESAGIQMMDFQRIKDTNMLHIRGTKTKNADRYVPVPDALQDMLPEKDPFEYLVPNQYGTMMTEGQRNILWNEFKSKLKERAAIAVDLRPYCLRHTYCTDLQKKGVDIRTAQYLMGHADIQMTANIYTHTDIDTVIRASEQMKKSESKKSVKHG